MDRVAVWARAEAVGQGDCMTLRSMIEAHDDFQFEHRAPPTELRMSPVMYRWFVGCMNERGEPAIFQGLKPITDREMDGFKFA